MIPSLIEFETLNFLELTTSMFSFSGNDEYYDEYYESKFVQNKNVANPLSRYPPFIGRCYSTFGMIGSPGLGRTSGATGDLFFPRVSTPYFATPLTEIGCNLFCC